jgi:hypothetical protein
MHWFTERRRAKKVAEFGFTASQQGGAFETNCQLDQILAWLKSTKV